PLDWPEHVRKAFEVYASQDWERSIRKAAKEVGRSHNTLLYWSTKYGWIERVNQLDLASKGRTFNRRKWRRAERKIAKYTSDTRFWTRAARRSYQRKLNGFQAAQARWGKDIPMPEDLRAFKRARQRTLHYHLRRSGDAYDIQALLWLYD